MKTNIIVRETTPADHAALYGLIKTAFETAEHRDCDEQDFAVGLRNGENYIPQLDLVAQVNGRLIGHIMLTRTYVTRPDGTRYHTLLVAPLSVLLEHRNEGVGSQLMNEGLRIAAEMGYTAAFLIGDPAYYARFGYRLSQQYGINHETLPAEYVQAKELTSAALEAVTGIIHLKVIARMQIRGFYPAPCCRKRAGVSITTLRRKTGYRTSCKITATVRRPRHSPNPCEKISPSMNGIKSISATSSTSVRKSGNESRRGFSSGFFCPRRIRAQFEDYNSQNE